MSELSRRTSNVALLQRSRQAGAGRFEFAVVAIIFAILAGVLLEKLRFYQQEAERLAVQQVVISLRAALASRASSLYLEGKQQDFAALARQNPMDWLARRPPNYAGEFDAPADGAVDSGNWYFDRSTTTLSYLLNKRELFEGNAAKRLNFKVKFMRNPSQNTKSNEGPGPGGVTLEEVSE